MFGSGYVKRALHLLLTVRKKEKAGKKTMSAAGEPTDFTNTSLVLRKGTRDEKKEEVHPLWRGSLDK